MAAFPTPHSTLWKRLQDAANEETTWLRARLPTEVKAKISSIPIIFEPAPSPELIADGVEPDVMGLFVGDEYSQEASHPVPTEIFLFLLNIWAEAGEEMSVYRGEVRKTLLHEWGHFIGLDENELSERDLD